MSNISEKEQQALQELQQQMEGNVEESGGDVLKEKNISVTAHSEDEQEVQLEAEREVQLEGDQEEQLEGQQEVQMEGEREVQMEGEQEGQLESEREVQLEAEREVQMEGDQGGQLEGQQEVQMEGDQEGQAEGERERQLRDVMLEVGTGIVSTGNDRIEDIATSARISDGANPLDYSHTKMYPKKQSKWVFPPLEKQNTAAAKGQLMITPQRASLAREVAYSFGRPVPVRTASNMSTREEHAAFRTRNSVASNYNGPVFVVEDIYVMCAYCGAPVDPVSRVPAGKLFFHPQCISCKLCGRANITEAYFKGMRHSAICSECALKGYAWWVPREAALRRGIVPGSIKGSIDDCIEMHNRKHKLEPINHSTVEGAIPPTLALGPLYGRPSHPIKMLSLIQRQQYYTQNDNNIICIPPSKPRRSSRTMSATQRTGKRGSLKKLV